MSLAPKGTPCRDGRSTPCWAACSAVRAAASARSASRLTQAWTLWSSSAARADNCSTSSTGETSRSRIRRAAWAAVRSCRATAGRTSAMRRQGFVTERFEWFLDHARYGRGCRYQRGLQPGLSAAFLAVCLEHGPAQLLEHCLRARG